MCKSDSTDLPVDSPAKYVESATDVPGFASHHNRQDEHRAAVVVKPALQFKHGVVVQPARHQAFILEHELAGKELRLRKFFGDFVAQFRRLLHDVRAQRESRLGIEPALAHVVT